MSKALMVLAAGLSMSSAIGARMPDALRQLHGTPRPEKDHNDPAVLAAVQKRLRKQARRMPKGRGAMLGGPLPPLLTLAEEPDGYSSSDAPVTVGRVYKTHGWMGSCVTIDTDIPGQTVSLYYKRFSGW